MALSTSEGLLDFPSGFKGLKLGSFNLAAPGLLRASLSWGHILTSQGLSQFRSLELESLQALPKHGLKAFAQPLRSEVLLGILPPCFRGFSLIQLSNNCFFCVFSEPAVLGPEATVLPSPHLWFSSLRQGSGAPTISKCGAWTVGPH